MRRIRILPVLIFLGALGLCGYYNYQMEGRLDAEAPEIMVPAGTLEVSVETPVADMLEGITARDGVDGDLTEHLLVESLEGFDENYERTLHIAVVDAAGNVARATRQVAYTDYHSPRFSLKEPLLNRDGFTQVIEKLEAEDILDGAISSRIKVSSRYHLKEAYGDSTMEFFVTNSAGDTALLTATVTTPDIASYLSNSAITLTDYLVYADASHKVDPWKYLESVQLQNTLYIRSGDQLMPEEDAYIRAGYPEVIEKADLQITNDVNYDQPGSYEILYSYTLENEQIAIRLIVIVE